MGLVIYLSKLCVSFPAALPSVSAVTPLVAEQFAWELRFHPQRPQVDFVLDGIRHGFKLGFSPSQKLKSCLLYTSPSPRDGLLSRMPSSA